VIQVYRPAACRNCTLASISQNDIDVESTAVISDDVVSNAQVFPDVVQHRLRCLINSNRCHSVLLPRPTMDLLRHILFHFWIWNVSPRMKYWLRIVLIIESGIAPVTFWKQNIQQKIALHWIIPMAMVGVDSGSLYSLSRLAWSWVGGRLAPFYIHQMNRVNSRNGSAMMTAP